MRDNRRYAIARSIALTIDSLGSHLNDAVSHDKRNKGNEEFDARCVTEYAFTAYTLAVELHQLTLQDFKVAFEGIKPRFK